MNSRARSAVAKGSQIANTVAGPIEYAERGDGTPLLSIHGAGGGWDQGLTNVADLVGDRFRVIAPSRFGYLGTPIPTDVSPAAQADAHRALLSTLMIDKAIVVGVSAGARSAIELALRHPDYVSALILIVPGSYTPQNPVMVEGSRGSAFVLWLVNAGADFAWWAMEKIAPSHPFYRSTSGTGRSRFGEGAGPGYGYCSQCRTAFSALSRHQH